MKNLIRKILKEETVNYDDFYGDIDNLTIDEMDVLEDLLYTTESEFNLNDLIDDLNKLKLYKDIFLYRVVWIKNKEDIDVKKLGLHYVTNPDVYDMDWVENLYPFHFKEDEPDIEDDLWIITISVPTEDIDYKATLVNNIKYPYEEEIQLKTDKNIKVVNISKFFI